MIPSFEDFLEGREKIAVVGLGYVGLPLSIALSKNFKVIGYDKNKKRIEELQKGIDKSGEISRDEILSSNIFFTEKEENLKLAKLIIISVPTPTDKNTNPDLQHIISSTQTVGKYLQRWSIVVYESTVYPGVTEEICVPILEKVSGLKFKVDFKVGYSPERINPGDKEHTIYNVVKIVAGCDEETLELLSKIYGKITNIYKAKSIKVAEAAKVIENTQRDLNIALMNELAIIFHKIGLNTKDVLEAAGTKWNFLKFEPGLVGGHCIGVDPYYLTWKAKEAGHHPQVILSGRAINDSMGKYVAEETVKLILKNKKKSRNVFIAGITFKENIRDIRNSKVVDIINALQDFGFSSDVFDPVAYEDEVLEEYGIRLKGLEECFEKNYAAVIVAVKHREFYNMLDEFIKIQEKPPIIVDVKSIFYGKSPEGVIYWAL